MARNHDLRLLLAWQVLDAREQVEGRTCSTLAGEIDVIEWEG
jgi:hypothetical protein